MRLKAIAAVLACERILSPGSIAKLCGNLTAIAGRYDEGEEAIKAGEWASRLVWGSTKAVTLLEE